MYIDQIRKPSDKERFYTAKMGLLFENNASEELLNELLSVGREFEVYGFKAVAVGYVVSTID